MEIRMAALKLLEIAGISDPARIAFIGGGGAVLEALKVSKRHGDKDWKPEDCPSFDPEKPVLLSSLPLNYDASLPLEWLYIVIDGRPIAGGMIDMSIGCSGGITAPKPPKEPEAPAAIAPAIEEAPTSRRRNTRTE